MKGDEVIQMNIKSFKNINHTILSEKDDSQKYIGYSHLQNCTITGRNNYYPNILLNIDSNLNNKISEIISPYDEKIMSLNKDSFYDNNTYEYQNSGITYNFIETPVFFFIYNFDNYYHFLYDTIPYLYTYLQLKKDIPLLKLLVYYPNKNMNDFYIFNKEILFKIISNESEYIIHNENNKYNNIYISTSLTHNESSNNKPRNEIFEIYNMIKKNINYNNIRKKYINKPYIYISRRTWIHNDYSNIGTNYTTRRKMMNENELVEKLNENNFYEVFAEQLNIDEKIYIFSNANSICGSIGGGMCNLLFSNNNCNSFIIVSPEFLKINERFKYSMDHTNITYYSDCQTYIEENNVPLFTRIKITDVNNLFYDKYGEIINYANDLYLVNISNNDVAGFNNNIIFDQKWISECEFIKLDNGLNSPYIMNIQSFINIINKNTIDFN